MLNSTECKGLQKRAALSNGNVMVSKARKQIRPLVHRGGLSWDKYFDLIIIIKRIRKDEMGHSMDTTASGAEK